MNAVTKAQDQVPEVVSQASSLLEIISRAARDPDVDVDKLERLMAMAERIEARNAKAAYYRAMAVMKPLLPIIDRKGRIVIHEKGKEKIDANIVQSTDYAKWEDIDAAITPILAAHGFALTFRPGVAQDGKITVTGILTHSEGHSEEATITLPHDSSGSKNAVQAVGSSSKYGMRYAATMLLNIRTRGEDDDGKAGGDPSTITEEQAERILELLTKDKADVQKFCAYMKTPSILELPASEYTRAIEVINTRSQKVTEKEKAAP